MTFDAMKNEVRPMRSKEESHDYRSFPEPDLPPLVLKPEWLAQQRADLPELPGAARRRLTGEGLSDYDAGVVTSTASLGRAYQAIRGTGVGVKDAANWLINDVLSLTDDPEAELPVTPAQVADVVALVQAQTISRQSGRKVLEELSKQGGGSARQIAERLGLIQVQDTGQIDAWVRDVIAAHPAEVARLKAGESKLLGFLTGQVMKLSKGKADAKAVGAALQAALQ
jgi:aspartyl-tRNA(Asn)/glutamyl-tRNA(Gln) amidotransferase subunit B